MGKSIIRFWLGYLLLASILTGLVGSVVLLPADPNKMPLQYSAFIGANKSIEFDQILNGEFSDKFANANNGSFQTGYGKRYIWLKFLPFQKNGVLDFGNLAEDVVLYIPNQTGNDYRTMRSGKMLRPSQRDTLDTFTYFSLENYDQSKSVFARMDQETSVMMEVSFVNEEKYFSDQSRRLTIHKIALGAVSIMILFNIALGLITRDVLFFLNSAVIFSASLVAAANSGFGPAFLWGEWAQYTVVIFDLGIMIGTPFSTLFFYKFITNPKGNPTVVRLMLVIPVIFLVVFLVWTWAPMWVAHALISIANSFYAIYMLTTFSLLSFQGSKPARIMLPALFISIVPVNIMLIASLFFLKPTIIPQQHVVEFMMISEAILFSLVLAYRIRVAKDEAIGANTKLEFVQARTQKLILQSIDNERQRVAADLHDTAGQGLMSITARLSRVLNKGNMSETQKAELNKVADYSRNVVGDIRRISHELHPAIIDHLGWKNAVEELFVNLKAANSVQVDLKIDVEETALNDTQKLHLYRIVQELVSNISKHSDASKCKAVFSKKDCQIIMEISDDGQSDNSKNQSGRTSSLGLLIIQQRISVLEGKWSVERDGEQVINRLSFPV